MMTPEIIRYILYMKWAPSYYTALFTGCVKKKIQEFLQKRGHGDDAETNRGTCNA